ncbi:MAG: hypothetical protein HZC55_16080 [Verrucomicrobia bacterium]|nr:hypothetical protein [Verrucomicrobiota bacterium]
MKNASSRLPSPPPPARSGGPAAAGPIRTLRLGRLKAAIWENASENRSFYNVTFSRAYLDEQKQWHDSDSFGRDDLLVLGKLADQAHTYICERMSGQRGEEP